VRSAATAAPSACADSDWFALNVSWPGDSATVFTDFHVAAPGNGTTTFGIITTNFGGLLVYADESSARRSSWDVLVQNTSGTQYLGAFIESSIQVTLTGVLLTTNNDDFTGDYPIMAYGTATPWSFGSPQLIPTNEHFCGPPGQNPCALPSGPMMTNSSAGLGFAASPAGGGDLWYANSTSASASAAASARSLPQAQAQAQPQWQFEQYAVQGRWGPMVFDGTVFISVGWAMCRSNASGAPGTWACTPKIDKYHMDCGIACTNTTADGVCVVGGDMGGGWLYVSVDGGATWDQQAPNDDQHPDAPFNTPFGLRAMTAFTRATQGESVLVIAGGNANTPVGGIFASYNTGATWTQELSTVFDFQTCHTVMYTDSVGQAWQRVYCLGTSIMDGAIVYAKDFCA
jgi:hypothetical protein